MILFVRNPDFAERVLKNFPLKKWMSGIPDQKSVLKQKKKSFQNFKKSGIVFLVQRNRYFFVRNFDFFAFEFVGNGP